MTLRCFHNIAPFIWAVLGKIKASVVCIWSLCCLSQSFSLYAHTFCSLPLYMCVYVQWNRKGAGHVFSATTHHTIPANFLDCFQDAVTKLYSFVICGLNSQQCPRSSDWFPDVCLCRLIWCPPLEKVWPWEQLVSYSGAMPLMPAAT